MDDSHYREIEYISFDTINKEIADVLHTNAHDHDFWYWLGAMVAGPIYLALYKWLKQKSENSERDIWVLTGSHNSLFHSLTTNEHDRIHCIEVYQILRGNDKSGEPDHEKIYEKLNDAGFFERDCIVFDPSLEGDFQNEIEALKKEYGIKIKHDYCYFGIINSDKARKNVHKKHYDTYLFDFYRNQFFQRELLSNRCILNILFPWVSVFWNNGADDSEYCVDISEMDNRSIEKGCADYLKTGIGLISKTKLSLNPVEIVAPLRRLISHPTGEEAIMIGNLEYYKKSNTLEDKCWHIALLDEKNWEDEIKGPAFWWAGFFERSDIPENLKEDCADHFRVRNPKEPYNLEDEQSIRNYHRWIKYNENHKEMIKKLDYYPSFSVVIPVYNTLSEQLEECISSVLSQYYDNYQLILIDDHSSWENVVPVLKKYEDNSKVRVIYRESNGHISAATNDGIEVADGEFIVLMDCDDIMEPIALYEFAKILNDNRELDFIYSDEDKITEDGKIRHMPIFKPDWSPSLFLNLMYTNHLAAYRRSIVNKVGGMRTRYNGSQDYDLVLRFMEMSDDSRVGHVPKVLYHWRERQESTAYEITSKSYAVEAARLAKIDYIERNGIKAHLEFDNEISQYRFVYEVVGKPLVSIIIPSKDHPEILRQCIDSIEEYSDYKNYEIIVVDNGSCDENKITISNYLRSKKAKYIYRREPFNFSKMCNKGAGCSSGEYLLFMNDDVEIFQPDWLNRMLGQAQQDKTGAVGAKLYYPETTIIQHAGVANIIEGPSHNFMMLDDSNVYHFGWNRMDYDCIAVTGACLLIKTTKFREVGGFDKSLPVAYNDVKLCFALHKCGYRNVIRNDVVAYHHESLSRGNDHLDDEKLKRLSREKIKLFSDFPELQGYDPYLNINLHNFTNGLDFKVYYDELNPIDLTGAEPAETANIDVINIAERIQIFGWSILENENHIEELDRYLVFEDPYGETLAVKVLPMSRPDVVESFCEKLYKYCGFEAVCRLDELRFDIMSHHIGVLTISRDKKKYLKWCRYSNIIRRVKSRPFARSSKTITGSLGLHVNNDLVRWNIDECQHCSDYSYHVISGFAYKKSNYHYRYSKSLILVDDQDNAIEFEVHLNERVDVAYSFPNEHYLYYTGFSCYVFDDVLVHGMKYRILIRLKNVFDDSDYIDVETGLIVGV